MLDMRLPLGPFIIEPGGRLQLRGADTRPAFWFMWKGLRVDAKLGAGGVTLSMLIGRIPSTIKQPAVREPAFALLRALPGTLPEGWTMRLTPEHTIRVQAFDTVALPATISGLVEPLVRFLLRVSPYLELIEQAGLGAKS
jgi:hypothetical protein